MHVANFQGPQVGRNADNKFSEDSRGGREKHRKPNEGRLATCGGDGGDMGLHVACRCKAPLGARHGRFA
jgi:hypothetical protein